MVVALSGGPDSVALLRALIALRLGPAAGTIVLAHLNHQLRGAESDGDQTFVEQLFASLQDSGIGQLQLSIGQVDIRERAAAEKDNLEACARRARYAWLAQVAQEHGIRWIATGHTADDQAETVLHRLLRGAGLRGLRGIAVRRRLEPGIAVVRPLLAVRRTEVMGYLEQLGQDFRLDSSNADLHYTRNRIRHELLPLLADQWNPNIASILVRLSQQAKTLYRESAAVARKLLEEAERPRAGTLLIFARKKLATVPRNALREMLRLAWLREGWPRGRMDFAAWDRLAGVALGELPCVDLPGGIQARCLERVVQLGPGH